MEGCVHSKDSSQLYKFIVYEQQRISLEILLFFANFQLFPYLPRGHSENEMHLGIDTLSPLLSRAVGISLSTTADILYLVFISGGI